MPNKNYKVSPVPVTLFAHLLFIAITTLILVWLLHFREGLAFTSTNKPKIFNIHPLLMVIGFLLLAGEAIMAYTTVPTSSKKHKLYHMILHFIALVAAVIGLYAVFKYHKEAGIPHMYTFHSWIGLSTIILFALQWLLSFLTFLFPGARTSTRSRVVPWHALIGIIIFFLAIVAAETGLVQKFIFLGLTRNQEGLIVNFTGLLILLFGISVGVAVLLPGRGY
ncbi:probable ascorbate-specific transmembrane electron transporter 1 [Nicotiana tomentosiformis]|uniref:probable ascorbate-specific transmembrane electron transporter 1 n=1 Tax=Nicotiana tomentosiformis TaxID=4098 RepID=UPI00051BD16B|nr:probable ascorbate-specific transmembrane electron transporter 1 [Nicotiana tomentosiformis]